MRNRNNGLHGLVALALVGAILGLMVWANVQPNDRLSRSSTESGFESWFRSR